MSLPIFPHSFFFQVLGQTVSLPLSSPFRVRTEGIRSRRFFSSLIFPALVPFSFFLFFVQYCQPKILWRCDSFSSTPPPFPFPGTSAPAVRGLRMGIGSPRSSLRLFLMLSLLPMENCPLLCRRDHGLSYFHLFGSRLTFFIFHTI